MARSRKKSGAAVTAGHILAFVTVVIWSVTFVATDYLLGYFTNTQLLMIRFIIAYIMLWLIYPKPMKLAGLKKEAEYALMSVFGVTGYYFLENIAIKNGGATNTSIIISCVPIVTVIIMCLSGRKERVSFKLAAGFVIAIIGICLVVFNGAEIKLNLNMSCVGACLGACVSWGIYSILIDKHSGTNPVQLSRRMLFWALAVIVPYTLMNDSFPSLKPLTSLWGAMSIIILGVFGSGLCYVMWNKAIANAGVEHTTNYLYIQPFLTMTVAVILGRDEFSAMSIIGALLIVSGVIISDKSK